MNRSDNTNSLYDALIEAGEKAEGRNRRGLTHPLSGILLLLTLGYMMGVLSYRGVYYTFKPSAVYSGDGDKPNKKAKKAAKKAMSPEEWAFWVQDMERNMAESAEKDKTILAQLQAIFPFKSIPHYSTMSRAIAAADCEEIIVRLYELFVMMVPETKRRHIAIDGKALRAAINKALENKSLYILNVYDVAARIFLTTYRVGEKKNEASTLVAEIKNILLGNPSIVTMDAAGTQQELIRLMVELGSEYVLPVKSNQPNLEKLLYNYFLSQSGDRTETIEGAIDLGGHDEYEHPSQIIEPTVFCVTMEANKKAGKYESNDGLVEAMPEEESPVIGATSAKDPAHEEEHTGCINVAMANVEQDTQRPSGGETIPKDGKTEQAEEPVTEENPAEENPEERVPVTGASPEKILPSEEEAPVPDIVSKVWSPWLFPFFPDKFYYGKVAAPLALDSKNKDLIVAQCGTEYILMARNGERFERTEFLVIQNPEILELDIFKERFESVKCIVLVNHFRLTQKYTPEYGKHWELSVNPIPYISNRLLTAEEAKDLISGHWRIEVGHHTLDAIMGEDLSTTRSENAPWLLSTLRKTVINMINYVGGKWATVSDKDINCTQGEYEVRISMQNNLKMAIRYLTMPLNKAVDVF